MASALASGAMVGRGLRAAASVSPATVHTPPPHRRLSGGPYAARDTTAHRRANVDNATAVDGPKRRTVFYGGGYCRIGGEDAEEKR
eukprot:gene19646-14260_t